MTQLIKYLLSLLGLGLMVGAFFAYQSTQRFIEESVSVPGQVTDLIKNFSTDSDGRRRSLYTPQIQFQTAEGKNIEFESDVSSNPPAYSRGEAVEVLYLPNSPEQAKIKSFTSLWLFTLILGGMGTLFLISGVGTFLYERMKKKKILWLQQFGRRLQTQYKSVEWNTDYKVNGKSPYQIFSQWDENGGVYMFHSENLWFDPNSYLKKDQEITVLVDPQDMKKYWMDISFLPTIKN